MKKNIMKKGFVIAALALLLTCISCSNSMDKTPAINEDELIKEREKVSPLIYSIRPGLTGLAQIDLIEDRHNPALKAQKDFEYYQNMMIDNSFFIISF